MRRSDFKATALSALQTTAIHDRWPDEWRITLRTRFRLGKNFKAKLHVMQINKDYGEMAEWLKALPPAKFRILSSRKETRKEKKAATPAKGV